MKRKNHALPFLFAKKEDKENAWPRMPMFIWNMQKRTKGGIFFMAALYERVQKFRTAHNIIHFGQNLPHCMRPHYVQFYGCRGYLQVQRRKVRSADSSVRAIQQIIIVWNVKMARVVML